MAILLALVASMSRIPGEKTRVVPPAPVPPLDLERWRKEKEDAAYRRDYLNRMERERQRNLKRKKERR